MDRNDFDLLTYLREALPGFTFSSKSGPRPEYGGLVTVEATTTLRMGVKGEFDPKVFPAPEEAYAQLQWADQLITKARLEAARLTGMDKAWEARERELKLLHEQEKQAIHREAERRINEMVGKAFLAGKAEGRAEEMRFAGGEDDDD